MTFAKVERSFSLVDLSRAIHKGEITPVELVERCLAVIDKKDPQIQAWAYVARDEARAADSRAAAREPLGPLDGIPFGVKDIFDAAGMPTAFGSALFAGAEPCTKDSGLVAQLRREGAIPLGKTHTTAFAYFDAGPTRNPHNLEHTPGGSSSGSAAAVAAQMAPFALGSQTQGSVLRPASYCGVVGFKPTYGDLPLDGVMPFARTLDHAGLFTATVEDMAFLWKAINGLEIELPAPQPPDAAVALPPWPIDGELESEMAGNFGAAVEELRLEGLRIHETELPASCRRLPEVTRTIFYYEGSRFHERRYRRHGEAIGAKLAALVEEGLRITGEQYEEALAALQAIRRDYAQWAGKFPLALTPAAPGAAPKGLESTGDPRANAPFTALGTPALAMPFGRTREGLPLGLQLAAPRHGEDLLLDAARYCERVLA